MTGNELARAIRATRGKIQAEVLIFADVAYLYVEKADLIAWALCHGENETKMTLSREDLGVFFQQTEEETF